MGRCGVGMVAVGGCGCGGRGRDRMVGGVCMCSCEDV